MMAWFRSKEQNMFIAAKNGDLAGVQMYLDRGANIEWKNTGWVGETALYAASKRGHVAVVNELLRRGANIHATTDKRHFMRSDALDCDAWTPLHAAAHSGHVAVIECLLDAGADPTRETLDCSTARSLAVEEKHTAVVDALDKRLGNPSGAVVDGAQDCVPSSVELTLEG
ncbi:hypothetical protein H310_06581 [Aphanomyces invadans]|uniref:Uncharacterized protein n=1 Tax=Aphanomyces invadans TaxID=157072 RepID=A0A024U3Z6_9STRA|nr:hypothetical protein H310_06581 [Aphanomyces invadans]ETW00925.1 hypothetical protein H310_06581 [Aphanomyces invadans]|eukprot:XP_008869923.1 hypothetical protein H310_06581 [Aphanomyces invadans]